METNLDLTTPKKSNSLGLYAFGAIAIVAGVIGYKTLGQNNNIQSKSNSNTVNLKPANANYRDGIYDVVGEYVSPGGPESIGVKLTIKNNVVTEATVVKQATLEKSQKFQSLFVENYKAEVIGKSINNLKLDKVAGSSLTPKGFNDALEKIKTQAQS